MDRAQGSDQPAEMWTDIRYGVGYLVIAALGVAAYFASRVPDGELVSSGVRDTVHSCSAVVVLIAGIVGLSYLLRGLFSTRQPR